MCRDDPSWEKSRGQLGTAVDTRCIFGRDFGARLVLRLEDEGHAVLAFAILFKEASAPPNAPEPPTMARRASARKTESEAPGRPLQ